MSSNRNSPRRGVLFGLAAYLWWGFVPVYFKAVAAVGTLEVLAHRVLWSVAVLGIILLVRGGLQEVGSALRDRRILGTLAASAALVALNWFVFIWAVAHGRVLQASLGYFVNPLVNVLLGFLFLDERLRPRQIVSVALAGAGVVYLTVSYGAIPWIALVLASTFGFYGLLRKRVAAGGLVGLTVETLLLLPLAVACLSFLAAGGELTFAHRSHRIDLLLAAGGVVTALPLLWFAEAARRLRYATMGFLQYLAPSLQLLLAVVAYREPFTTVHLVSFGCIWSALALYAADALAAGRAEALSQRAR